MSQVDLVKLLLLLFYFRCNTFLGYLTIFTLYLVQSLITEISSSSVYHQLQVQGQRLGGLVRLNDSGKL